MKTSIPGAVLLMLLTVLCLIVTPLYYISIIQYAKAENEMMSDVANVIDKVIDTRELTEDMLADLNIALAAKPMNYTLTITRETIVTNPDPSNPGSTYSVYVVADDIYNYRQGDIITIRVEMFGESMMTQIASKLLGLHLADYDYQIAGRVR